MTTRRASADDGSATVWVLSCIVLLSVVAAVGVVRTVAVLARHRAEGAADLAAVAAAEQSGVAEHMCAAAERIAQANGARLTECLPDLATDGRTGSVRVRVAVGLRLPLVGRRDVVATAVAGRLPDSSALQTDVDAPLRAVRRVGRAPP